MAGKVEVLGMGMEKCEKKATYLVGGGDAISVLMCIRHFTSADIQYMITREWLSYERLENSEEKCEVEVERKAPNG